MTVAVCCRVLQSHGVAVWDDYWHSKRAFQKWTLQYELNRNNSCFKPPETQSASRKFGQVHLGSKRPRWRGWRTILRQWACATAHEMS